MEGIRLLKSLKAGGDEILRLEARICHAKMDYGTASERLLSLKKMEAGDMSLLQDTLLSARDVDKALAVFQKNLLKLGGNSLAYIKLADVFHEKGKKKEALQWYQKVLENDPMNEWALYRAGSLMAGEEGQKLLGRIKSETSLLGKFARAGLKEIEIRKKVRRFFVMLEAGHLHQAFSNFTAASKSLEAYYQKLQEEVHYLTGILEETNQQLSEALSQAEESKDFLNGILQGLEEAIIVLDPEERVTMLNRAAEDLLEHRAIEMIGRSFHHLDITILEEGTDTWLVTQNKKIQVIISRSLIQDSEGLVRGYVVSD